MNWKPTSLSHIVSILAIMITLLGINAITFYYIHIPSNTQLLFIALTNITGLIGMSYYMVSFSANEQGVSIQSKPQTTT
jgi:hypothetical protein